MISSLGDMLRDSVEGTGEALTRAFSDPSLRLGVTGLSRAGKTVFITSLVPNLMERGRVGQSNQMRALYAGHLPDHTDHILAPAREGARDWSDHEFVVTDFALPISSLRAGLGPPHIRLDTAAEFLLADRMG